MTVRAGKPCRITLGHSLGGIAEARVLRAATVGKSEAQGTSVVYNAKAGFAGVDSFLGRGGSALDRWGKDQLWSVAVAVKVIP